MERIYNDWNTTPTRPTIDMEPRYEGIDGGCGKFNGHQTRIAAWWGVFAGGFGFGYGQHPLWYWNEYGANSANGISTGALQGLLGAEFSGQVGHLKNLMLSRPFFSRVPDPGLVGNACGVGATRGDGYIMVYAGSGQSFSVDTSSLSGKNTLAWWYSPRDGSVQDAGTDTGGGSMSFSPPSSEDWALVIDDAGRGFAQPGA